MLTVQQFMSLLGHSWQDIALAMGNIFFCVTLVPMLRHPDRPPLLTCVPTGLGLLARGFVFADPASLGHGADPSYNRPPVARFGFQKNSVEPPRHCSAVPHQIAASWIGAAASEWASLLESREISRS